MDSLPPSTFRSGDEERPNVDKTNEEPQCIKDLPVPEPDRVALTDKQLSEEMSRLVSKDYVQLEFPRKRKFRVDPKVPGQQFGLVSFIPSKGANPDTNGCYGVLKLRGNFQTEAEADKWSEHLVRNFDNFSEIDMVYVGNDFPLMHDNTIYTKTTREIDIRKLVDDTTKSAMREKEMKEQQEIKEMQERQKRLLDKTNSDEKDRADEKDIDYYVQLRVKKANALFVIDEAEKKIKEAQGVVEKSSVEIEELDKEFPDYAKEFLARYENAIKATGGNMGSNPLIPFMHK